MQFYVKMDEEYGVVFSCYCFYNAWYDFVLSDATDRYRNEFEVNSNWLRFGFHGYGFDETDTDRTYEMPESAGQLLKDFELVTNQLLRITSKKNIDKVLRLSSYKGSRDGLEKLRDCGVEGFLCAEDEERESYYLEKKSRKLYEKGKIRDNKIGFYRTGIRVENEEEMEKSVERIVSMGLPLIVFSHE